jgi:hypothetical protein
VNAATARKLMKSPNPVTRINAIRAISPFDVKPMQVVHEAAVRDPVQQVRLAAVEALQVWASDDYALLERLADDPDPVVAEQARRKLTAII